MDSYNCHWQFLKVTSLCAYISYICVWWGRWSTSDSEAATEAAGCRSSSRTVGTDQPVWDAHLLGQATDTSAYQPRARHCRGININSTHSWNKKAVLSQRWKRDARYISRSWAVTEIWPFEIIQDVGGRHLEFIQIENSAIKSAVTENPTL